MNALNAFYQTIDLARDNGMASVTTKDPSLSYAHLLDMADRIQNANPPFSYGKLCRWLGWAQAAVVASGCGSLEEMKNINKSNG